MSHFSTDPTNRRIGIFDSGVGGLTVMRAVIDALPAEDLLYLGDTARVPYGNRGAHTIRRYALNAARLLWSHDIKALVVACNTASAYALQALREELDIPVFGVIQPAALEAARVSRTQSVAVLGTRGTVRSQSYQQALVNLVPSLGVYPVACPLLVPLAEEGWTDGEVTTTVIAHYLEPLSETDVDTLILGCTHYPLLRDAIEAVARRVLGEEVQLIDSANTTAAAVKDALGAAGVLRPGNSTPGIHRFFLTDLPEGFIDTAERFFGRSLDGSCEHVDIVATG